MKRAAIAVNRLIHRVSSAVGLEGAFFLTGSGLLATGSSYIHPAGPLFVVGAACVLVSLSLVIPDKEP